MNEKRIGVILPAFNEAAVIKDVLLHIPESITRKNTTYTLVPVVIDDGSRDETALVARKNKRAHVIKHILNTGAGAATRTGLHYLRDNDFLFGATMDADGQHDPHDLLKVINAAIDGKADLIVGSRLVNTKGMPFHKIIGNKGLSLFTRILLGVSSSDTQSGLKAFNRKTLENLSYREDGYAFCSELLWRAHKSHLTIAEVPIKAIYTDHSKAKGQSSWNGFQIIKQLIKHRVSDFIHE